MNAKEIAETIIEMAETAGADALSVAGPTAKTLAQAYLDLLSRSEVSVPVEPTEEMIGAFLDDWFHDKHGDRCNQHRVFRSAHKAMIQAHTNKPAIKDCIEIADRIADGHQEQAD